MSETDKSCGRGICAAQQGHEGTCDEASGWVMPEHVCDTGYFDRTLCPEPCGVMHSYCDTCGTRADDCAHEASR